MLGENLNPILTVALNLVPSGTETSESYLSGQDDEISKNYPQGPRLKFQDASVGPIKFFERKFFTMEFRYLVSLGPKLSATLREKN